MPIRKRTIVHIKAAIEHIREAIEQINKEREILYSAPTAAGLLSDAATMLHKECMLRHEKPTGPASPS